MLQIIHIEPAAPAKPPEGLPCNGCGVCCLSEPCPLGRWLTRSSTGACSVLRWSPDVARYQCGALTDVRAVLQARWPGPGRAWLRWLGARLLARLAPRWIAAGQGCDCSLEVQRPAIAEPGISRPESDRQ